MLPPGATTAPGELNVATSVRELLGDSLPNARYFFAARVRFNWRTTELEAEQAELRR